MGQYQQLQLVHGLAGGAQVEGVEYHLVDEVGGGGDAEEDLQVAGALWRNGVGRVGAMRAGRRGG